VIDLALAQTHFADVQAYLNDHVGADTYIARAMHEAEALVAELRAARAVVEATRDVGHGPTTLHWNPQCAQCRAIAAYDKVVG
jgi:hypothetical protein